MNLAATSTDSLPSRWALAGLALCTLLASLGTSSASVALPAIAEAYGAAFHEVQWVLLAYLLATTVSLAGVGRLGDVLGRRRVLLAGLVLFTTASAVAGTAPSLHVLVAARAGQGLGAAVLVALSMALVAEAVPKERTGSAMGLLGTMSAVGTALGPSAGGVLTASFGWRAVFLVNVPLALAALGAAWRHLPVDRPGGAGAARPEGTLSHSGILSALLVNAVVSTVIMATLVVGPFYLSRGLGLGPALVGLGMSAGPLVAASAGLPAGRLVDRFGAGRTTVAALAGMAAGCALLALATPALGVAGYVVPLVVVTAHYALFQAANTTAVVSGIAPDRRGVVSALLGLSRNVGLVAGASLMAAVFAYGSGTADVAGASAEAVTVGLRTTFRVSGGLLLAALALAIGVPRRGGRDRTIESGDDPSAQVPSSSGWISAATISRHSSSTTASTLGARRISPTGPAWSRSSG